MRLLNWHLGYWFLKKKEDGEKKPNITFSSKCLLKLSCRLVSRAHAVLCASVCEVALSLSLLFFLLPFYICSTCSSHSSYLKSPVHFFFLKRNITSFCQLGGKRGESTEWKTRGEHQTHTHTHIKNKKKKLLVWNRAVALKCHKYFFLSRQGIRVSDLCFPAFFLFSPSAPSVREDLN